MNVETRDVGTKESIELSRRRKREERSENGDAERGGEEGHWDRSDESTKRAHRA